MENVGQNSADAAENSGPDRPREELLQTIARTITELLAPLDRSEQEAVLRELTPRLAVHYSEEIFKPLTSHELHCIQWSLQNSTVPCASDRLHAQWARHLLNAPSAAPHNPASRRGG